MGVPVTESAIWIAITKCLSHELGLPLVFETALPLAGGDISPAYQLKTSSNSYFVKLGDTTALDMFMGEFEGLCAIASAESIRCPRPLKCDIVEDHAFLALEYIPLSFRGDEAAMGQLLAQMHRNTASQFGWPKNNWIGSNPQYNERCDDWCEFWQRRRLEPQLKMAEQRGAPAKLIADGMQLLSLVPDLLSEHQPQASLLHGDLWGGNHAFDEQGNPVIFDPATYYGDRETDIAMTKLFAGFGRRFHEAYEAAWPLPSGHERRYMLYNLYHILNHFNLFGGGYANQAMQMTKHLLREIG